MVSKKLFISPLCLFAVLAAGGIPDGDDDQLPQFGRNTVLVWKMQNPNTASEFVVRIADFNPDRFLEWETSNAQGTVFMPARDIQEADNYVNRSLFVTGVDKKSRKATTLWLSRRIFRDLKQKGKAKCRLDDVGGKLELLGKDRLAVEVNGFLKEIPAIRVSDNRGAEMLFLDQEENPLMLRQKIRTFSQTLTSITTDSPNRLRWIKGRKLKRPVR
jgi:hypothetical protein